MAKFEVETIETEGDDWREIKVRLRELEAQIKYEEIYVSATFEIRTKANTPLGDYLIKHESDYCIIKILPEREG